MKLASCEHVLGECVTSSNGRSEPCGRCFRSADLQATKQHEDGVIQTGRFYCSTAVLPTTLAAFWTVIKSIRLAISTLVLRTEAKWI